jgi:hypothetical protein
VNAGYAENANSWPVIDEGEAEVTVGTRYDDIAPNEVLWITPETYWLPESPGGFALRVDELPAGNDGGGQDSCRVWVRGPVLLDAAGTVLRTLTLCVPVDQPRAVLVERASGPWSSTDQRRAGARHAVGVAATRAGAHRGDEPVMVEHAGRLYRRVEIPRQ